MKHGLALFAAGLVLLVGALLVAHPPATLAAGAETCLLRAANGAALDEGCALEGGEGLGAPGIALIFFIGGLAALGSGIVALRVACPPTHARRRLGLHLH
ncbi:hypothetical protein ARC20_00010 [Stenotrophomonas panacihumi]|uniref:Uncharacterized protein n=1 Tax=Stenotrophomonas panacihumi TaxID=676599 RepID=A0A0R0B8W4_9GAMM|nr:hypothetical protein [Stenotrophomonas panacihumi]KRG49267.1 hypothetical protein ARC20_00010 [Stenotrophomonas panacihumi]PTN53966.1 hypothetical protein C9J98_13270 [Stenotrophomonas panacihumi]